MTVRISHVDLLVMEVVGLKLVHILFWRIFIDALSAY